MKFTKLTPNLVVRDVQAAVQFYQSVLGFQPAIKVPDQPPFVFASVTSGDVEIFFNDQKAVAQDYPPLAKDPIGGTMTLFLECDGIEDILRAIEKSGARIVMPLKTQFYGMREFAFVDPQGWTVTMAERVKES
ncbi:MAG TPA: VOC family protein [Terriglobales bacterium]|nr:VOC family protein [Terriglobales bacterium]